LPAAADQAGQKILPDHAVADDNDCLFCTHDTLNQQVNAYCV
jgi:hypothetical protein